MSQTITHVIDATGAFGVALLMFLENVFPPLPSELIMPLAGFVAVDGRTSLWLVILGGSAGSLAGAVLHSQYPLVTDWLDPASTGVVVLLVAICLYHVVTHSPSSVPVGDSG